MQYKTTGVCSRLIHFDIVDNKVTNVEFVGGCAGNAQGLARLIEGMDVNEAITRLEGMHAGANPISGDFSLQSAGFMIRDGKKAEYVKSFTVAGNFYDLLKNIVALANNSHLPNAMGSTAFGAPSTLVENLSIAGK